MSLPDAATLAELVRLPAVLSVPGDAWTGAAVSGSAGRRGVMVRQAAMPAASALIYLGGMALNDWADRTQDAVERPERPIPSGRISAPLALAVGSGMVVAGVAVAGAVGGRAALRIAVPLAGAVLVYDVIAKDTDAGPLAMAACRTLDVLLGAADGGLARALPAALVVGAHTVTVTEVSRHEVHGATAAVARTAMRATLLTGLTSLVAGAWWTRRASRTGRGHVVPAGVSRSMSQLGLAAYLVTVAGGYRRAVAAAGASAIWPDELSGPSGRAVPPIAVRQAVGAGVMGIIPLQASMLAAARAPGRAAIVAAAIPAGRALRRRRAVT